MGAEYHQSNADYLDGLAAEHGWTVIDGERPHREIHEEIVSLVQPLLWADEFHRGSR
jgi:thymidylate kinase